MFFRLGIACPACVRHPSLWCPLLQFRQTGFGSPVFSSRPLRIHQTIRNVGAAIPRRHKSSSAPGWTRTSDLGIRNLRRDDFASPEETTKSTFSLCPSTTSESTFDFASTASFTVQRAKKGADLRNPQIQVCRGGGEAAFVVEPEVELRESVGLNVRELSRAEDLIHDHLELIKQKWADYLG